MAERVLASRVTIVPLETLENVLALTSLVKRGRSNRDSVGEEETMDGDPLRGGGVLQSCISPRPPAFRTRASGAAS
jgi:hypothetical protein